VKLLVLAFAILAACQSAQEKDALILKERVDGLQRHGYFKPLRCEMKSELSAPQAQKYRTAFPEEQALVDEWTVVYEWLPRSGRCEVHANPLTPASANQRAFVEEALCTLMQVFWVHSPFDGLRVLPTDIVDQDEKIFIRQRENSDLGIYLDKKTYEMETLTAKNGTFHARYEKFGDHYLPANLEHKTVSFRFVLRDFEWSESSPQDPPKSFWIHVGEMDATPTPRTKLTLGECKAL
jgi:hypothetical protein